MPPKRTPSRPPPTSKDQSKEAPAKPNTAGTKGTRSKFGFSGKNKTQAKSKANTVAGEQPQDKGRPWPVTPAPSTSQFAPETTVAGKQPQDKGRPWPITPAPSTSQFEPAPPKVSPNPYKVRQLAEKVVNEILDHLPPPPPESKQKGSTSKEPKIEPEPRKDSANQAKRNSSTPFDYYTPPDEAFLTPPEIDENELKVIYKNQDQDQEKDNVRSTKVWHESEVSNAMKAAQGSKPKKLSRRDRDSGGENLPLLPNIYGDDEIPLEATARPPAYDGKKIPSRTYLSRLFFRNTYPMSSKFTNRDYRQRFASRMLFYKAIHMLSGYVAAIAFQMTWTWEREIQELGPPDLVRIVQDNFWMAYIVLALYLSLAVAVRVFHKGRNKPYNRIVYASFMLMFSFKCYAACVGFGELVAGIITTLTYTLVLSYALLSILLALDKFPKMLDLDQVYIYRTAFVVVLLTAPLSCVFNYVELKITDSVFQKQTGLAMSFLEDYLPSTVLACAIFLWEVFRMKKILDGSLVSLENDDEYLFGAFFI